jgi:hypothetical protein
VPGEPTRWHSRFARNAITRMLAITTLITWNVLLKSSPSSVMPFVSRSMNPAPRKKHAAEKLPRSAGRNW